MARPPVQTDLDPTKLPGFWWVRILMGPDSDGSGFWWVRILMGPDSDFQHFIAKKALKINFARKKQIMIKHCLGQYSQIYSSLSLTAFSLNERCLGQHSAWLSTILDGSWLESAKSRKQPRKMRLSVRICKIVHEKVEYPRTSVSQVGSHRK